MEQTAADGTPRPLPDRWSATLPGTGSLSLLAFIRALIRAPPGNYRVIVFIVTDTAFSRAGRAPTTAQAEHWVAMGLNRLPRTIGMLPYGRDHTSIALVYAFEKRRAGEEAIAVRTSAVSGDVHLNRAGISDPLSKAP
jgi:hypothetical protein